jgi:SAM-dependent methyltransferase
VGATFPDLQGAESTAYYRQNEERLIRKYLPTLEGLNLFKTDLWDEAKNTRILCWAAGEGARVCGVDISVPIAVKARNEFSKRGLVVRTAVSDIRALALLDESFDAVYSMGTIEHIEETEEAVREIFRVLRPGGRAIIGVPNRWDPFLRPLMVAVLYRLGLYGYGYEKSYSRRDLRQMLERAGFELVAETGILFIPGWLRMLDLACRVWCRPLSRFTGLAVRTFAWLDEGFPRLQRYGYLIAAVATRPPR